MKTFKISFVLSYKGEIGYVFIQAELGSDAVSIFNKRYPLFNPLTIEVQS